MELRKSEVRSLKDQAVQLIVARKPRAALKCLRQAKALSPDDTWIILKLGECYERIGRMTSAISYYELTAQVFMKGYHYQKAEAMYKKILHLDPTDVDSRAMLDLLAQDRRQSRDQVIRILAAQEEKINKSVNLGDGA